MKISDIDKLTRSTLNLYDLTKLTFRTTFEGLTFLEYEVQKGEEMRIDLVCQSIYGNIDYVDIILNINNISNPLNIKEGSVIIYPTQGSIDSLKIKESKDSPNKKVVNKSVTSDPSRQSYIEGNYSLPPNVLESPTEQVVISGNNIKAGNGLFKK